MLQELALFNPAPKIKIEYGRKLVLEDLRDLAQQYYRIGNLTQADRLCGKILEQAHQDSIALNIRALIKFQKGAYPSALEILEDVLSRNSDNYQANCTSGRCYLAQKRIDEAIAIYRKAIDIAPKEAEAHIGLGLALTCSGQKELVQTCFEKAARLAPHDDEAFACLGAHYFRKSDLECAITSFLQAVENNDTEIYNFAGLKQAVDELMLRQGVEANASGIAFDSLPVFHTRKRSYSFQRFMQPRDIVKSHRIIHTAVDEYKPSMFHSLANYYTEIPARFPVFWNHKRVNLECHRDHLYVQNEKRDIIPTVLSHLETRMLSEKCPYYYGKHAIALVAFSPCRKTISGESFIIMDFSSFFGHFMWDELPYLILSRSLPETSKMRIVVPRLNSFHSKFLDFLGFPKENIITSKELTGDNQESGSIMIEDAWFPVSLPIQLSVEIVRQAFHNHISIPVELGQRKIYIQRGGQRLKNEAEIEYVLQQEGFETVRPETMTVADQIRVFGQARIIVGGIGSGLASMVWAPKGTAIVEIMSEVWPNNFDCIPRGIELMEHLKVLCRSLGHSFFRVSGKPMYDIGPSKLLDHVSYINEGRSYNIHFTNVHFTCDPEKVRCAVRTALEAQQFS
jgi:tetratricopeptide (TPR) repeat protein